MTATVIASPPASGSLRLALAQLDFPVGDISGNRDQVIQTIQRARDEFHADIVVFPELALSGPLPGDLLLREEFIQACEQAMQQIAESTQGITALVGWPQISGPDIDELGLRNAVSVLCDGKLQITFHKRKDPVSSLNKYSYHFIFDEPGEFFTFRFSEINISLAIGESDLFYSSDSDEQLILVINSPYEYDCRTRLRDLLASRSYELKKGIAWLNTVGGHDGVVFDGGSFLADADGMVHPPAALFEEHFLIADYDLTSRKFTPLYWPIDKERSEEAIIWKAITRGIADYCRKNGFDKVWLGLSGGIDSALVLALAVDALGAENVRAVSLPSRHTMNLSNDLALEQCQTLGVKLDTIPIEPVYISFLQTLGGLFAGLPADVAEENLQSRCRGTILMALTNKFGGVLLSTGNKSEYAVGYATIYGDMCGGYAPLKDVYKTQVYKLCRWRNHYVGAEVIPLGVIERAPSAELRDNQRDQDSLPPYEVLDDILYQHLELQQSKQAIIEAGHEAQTVARVLHLLHSSEWKRQQAAPGPKLSRCAFGQDRHYPISNGWRD